jgi:hypothetical protein
LLSVFKSAKPNSFICPPSNKNSFLGLIFGALF